MKELTNNYRKLTLIYGVPMWLFQVNDTRGDRLVANICPHEIYPAAEGRIGSPDE